MRFGYIDNRARLVIGPRFDSAREFSESRATVTENGNLGVIDANGRHLVRGARLCGKTAVLIDAKQRIVWPAKRSSGLRC